MIDDIESHDVGAAARQLRRNLRSDRAGTTRDEYAHMSSRQSRHEIRERQAKRTIVGLT